MGILSAIVASICCVGPLILIAVGLGSLGLGAAFDEYHWFFRTGALVLVGFGWRRYFKEKRTCNLKGCQMEKKRTTLISLIISSLAVAVFVGLNIYTYARATGGGDGKEMLESIGAASVVIPVKGITCFTCEVTVSSALKRIGGVVTARASAKQGNVEVVYDSKKTNISTLIKAINKTGYKARLPGDE